MKGPRAFGAHYARAVNIGHTLKSPFCSRRKAGDHQYAVAIPT